MKKAATQAAAVGSVAIYGTNQVGHGFIAQTADGKMFGDGEPMPHRSATAALWLGLTAIEATGTRGRVRVTIDLATGPFEAEIPDSTTRPYFGSLTWRPGRVYTIRVEDIIAAAEPEGR